MKSTLLFAESGLKPARLGYYVGATLVKLLPIVGALLLAGTANAATPANGPPKLLQPSGKWTVDYSQNMCVLMRSFGEGAGKVTIGFKPSPMSDRIRILVIRPGSSAERPAIGKAKIGFGKAAPNIDGEFTSGTIRGTQITSMQVDRDELIPLFSGAPLVISVRNRLNLAVQPDRLSSAMKALETCEVDLLKSWGMTEESVRSIVVRPKLEEKKVFQVGDYPEEALRNNQQGTTGVRVMVGADGKPAACKTVEPSGVPQLDETTCAVILRRALFEPARDASGKALATLTFVRITWQIEGASGYDYVNASPPAMMPTGAIN